MAMIPITPTAEGTSPSKKNDVAIRKIGVNATNGKVLDNWAEATAWIKYQLAMTSITEARHIEYIIKEQ